MYQGTLPGCTNLVHWLYDVPYNYTCLVAELLELPLPELRHLEDGAALASPIDTGSVV